MVKPEKFGKKIEKQNMSMNSFLVCGQVKFGLLHNRKLPIFFRLWVSTPVVNK